MWRCVRRDGGVVVMTSVCYVVVVGVFWFFGEEFLACSGD